MIAECMRGTLFPSEKVAVSISSRSPGWMVSVFQSISFPHTLEPGRSNLTALNALSNRVQHSPLPIFLLILDDAYRVISNAIFEGPAWFSMSVFSEGSGRPVVFLSLQSLIKSWSSWLRLSRGTVCSFPVLSSLKVTWVSVAKCHSWYGCLQIAFPPLFNVVLILFT